MATGTDNSTIAPKAAHDAARAVNPEEKNYAEIERLEGLLQELRAAAATTTIRETEAIREIGLEIAIAVREVGAMLINVGWEQSFAADRSDAKRPQP